jgi:AraC-like DNA-binding protein
MDQRMTRGEQNLLLLESIISGSEKLYVWCYYADGELVASSCPKEDEALLDRSFRMLGASDKMLEYTGNTKQKGPFLVGSPIGMQWAVTFETERKRSLIFVVGPVFYAAPSERQLRASLRSFTDSMEEARWSSELIAALPRLPVMPYAVFARYAVMVHNTLTGEQLGPEALGSPSPESGFHVSTAGARDREKVYMAERAMLQMVRNGDINYHAVIQRSVNLSPGVPVQGADPLRQMKTSIVVFTTLVSRAAMEGGLSPEVAYALGDSYLQSAEDCRDSGELAALANAMYHDFIYRVHHLRSNPGYSHAIQKCCDYIELSLDRKIRVADLAALVGYTEYYLTEKFKKETGVPVSTYIRFAKVERAKVLLEATNLSVREIAERLAFNTVNYFIQSFRETAGCTPAQYRKKKRKALDT